MSDQQDLIQQFASLTGANELQSKFFLEANNWDLELAASQFFENGGAEVPDMTSSHVPQQQQEQLVQPAVIGSSPTTTPAKRKPAPASSSQVRTLRDLMSSNENNSASDEEHENLYAGGEKSGMIVQGPNKRGGANLVDEILKKAAEGGQSPEEAPKKSQKKSAYAGVGYRLGSEDEPSTRVQPAVDSDDEEEEELESVTRNLTFWRNGFSVDDGPLYAYADPANQEMLNSINDGRAPLSLLNVRHGQPVEVRVVKRQDEDYVAPKVPVKPFAGTGIRLGSAASYSPSPPPSSSPAATTSPVNTITVDDAQPTTNIQIRLADGSRLIARLNHTHTVADIRRFIESSHPTTRAYVLQTTFPVKELKDNDQTVKEAGLLNSVIVQRYQ
ncbi:NSFL1 cofactor p47 [Choanephora cucurbitarum]|uniref:NSFL1 cofactor p47 n=1 Tax=Choanephora cucurbitarum TaxID=101091 RepID=A0A1C7NM27_9FUNG|nr:NSFL1 cofactor p47 [Choanephora cucurbitarum]